MTLEIDVPTVFARMFPFMSRWRPDRVEQYAKHNSDSLYLQGGLMIPSAVADEALVSPTELYPYNEIYRICHTELEMCTRKASVILKLKVRNTVYSLISLRFQIE